ncbi:MAG: chloride channel protein [Spirochaetia bacterium]|nr:chloride channel protein [Spirochaetia bacterium]
MALWLDRFRIKDEKSIYFYSLIIGIVSGLGAVVFSYALAYAEHFTFFELMGLDLGHPAGEFHLEILPDQIINRWYIFFLPVLGGLLAGMVSHFLCSEASGTGTDSMIHAFHHEEGRISAKVPLYKAIATIFTLASGGSAGKEGPVSQIGAGFGSAVAQFLSAGARARRTLLLVGMAGGLGAIFRAPLGGALTAVEAVYREDFESDSLVPAIIASVTSYLIYTSIMGAESIFDVGDVTLRDYRLLTAYLLLGFICSFLGWFFIKIFENTGKLFIKLKLHPVLKPALGGVFVGAVALLVPEILGSGFGLMQDALLGKGNYNYSGNLLELAGIFIFIAFLKMLTTSFTIGSGGSGGIFGPSLFVGGMIGGFVGCITAYLFPSIDVSIPSFILVGMGSFYGGVASAPIAGMIMVCDMIGSYALLPPLMLVSIISVTLSSKWSIYKGQVLNRFKSPAHYWDMNFDVLESMPISKNFRQNLRKEAIINKHMLLADLEKKSIKIHASDFIVVNSDNTYHGVISIRKIRLTHDYRDIQNLVTVGDVCEGSFPSLKMSDSLGEALRIISEREMDKIAIVDDKNQTLGYLRYIDIVSAYRIGVKKGPIESP